MTTPVLMLQDITHFFAYGLPMESFHFPGGVLVLTMPACWGESWGSTGPNPPEMGPVLILEQPQVLIPPRSAHSSLFCSHPYLAAPNLHEPHWPGQVQGSTYHSDSLLLPCSSTREEGKLLHFPPKQGCQAAKQSNNLQSQFQTQDRCEYRACGRGFSSKPPAAGLPSLRLVSKFIFYSAAPHLGGGGLLVTWHFEKSGVSFWCRFKEVRLRTGRSLPLLMKGFHLACWNFWPAETVHTIFERTGLLTNHKISSSCYITYFLNWDQLAMALWSRDCWHSPELALQTISCHSQAHVLMLPQRTDLLGKLRKWRPHANTRASKHRCHLPAMPGWPSGALPVRVVFTSQRPGLLLWGFWHLLPNLFTELNN